MMQRKESSIFLDMYKFAQNLPGFISEYTILKAFMTDSFLQARSLLELLNLMPNDIEYTDSSFVATERKLKLLEKFSPGLVSIILQFCHLVGIFVGISISCGMSIEDPLLDSIFEGLSSMSSNQMSDVSNFDNDRFCTAAHRLKHESLLI